MNLDDLSTRQRKREEHANGWNVNGTECARSRNQHGKARQGTARHGMAVADDALLALRHTTLRHHSHSQTHSLSCVGTPAARSLACNCSLYGSSPCVPYSRRYSSSASLRTFSILVVSGFVIVYLDKHRNKNSHFWQSCCCCCCWWWWCGGGGGGGGGSSSSSCCGCACCCCCCCCCCWWWWWE